MKILLIGAGGFIGAILRYWVSRGAFLLFGNKLPFGTLIVNVVGSFILGLVYTLAIERLAVGENMRFFIAVGLLGAFTTFSTFSVETLGLIQDGAYQSAVINIFANVILSLSAAFLGIYLARV